MINTTDEKVEDKIRQIAELDNKKSKIEAAFEKISHAPAIVFSSISLDQRPEYIPIRIDLNEDIGTKLQGFLMAELLKEKNVLLNQAKELMRTKRSAK